MGKILGQRYGSNSSTIDFSSDKIEIICNLCQQSAEKIIKVLRLLEEETAKNS
jgi:hypothetical protein